MIGFLIGFFTVGAWTGSWWLGGAAGVVLALVSVWWRPNTKCVSRRCRRDGPKVLDSKGTSWRQCFWCGGTGRRRRVLTRWIGGVDGD